MIGVQTRYFEGGECTAVKKRKLNYRFHNPNPAAASAEYILKVFMEVNQGKVEQAIRDAANQLPEVAESPVQEHSA